MCKRKFEANEKSKEELEFRGITHKKFEANVDNSTPKYLFTYQNLRTYAIATQYEN
jgi:hypothetical protein